MLFIFSFHTLILVVIFYYQFSFVHFFPFHTLTLLAFFFLSEAMLSEMFLNLFDQHLHTALILSLPFLDYYKL